MFNVGDEVAVIDEEWGAPEFPFPLKKGQRFTVLEAYPEGSRFGRAIIRHGDGIGIGLEYTAFRQYIEARGWNLPHYDLWPASKFRKVERKRAREELHQALGIDTLLRGRRELEEA